MSRRVKALKNKRKTVAKKIRKSVPPAAPIAVPIEEQFPKMQRAFREYAAKILGQQRIHAMLVGFGITGLQWNAMSKIKKNLYTVLYFLNPHPLSRKEQRNMARIMKQEVSKHKRPAKNALYQSFKDSYSCCYLRVEVTEDEQIYVTHTGKAVDAIRINRMAFMARGMEPLVHLPPIMAAQHLARPADRVLVTPEAQTYLDHILKSKEIDMNITANPPKKSAKKKSTTAKPAAAKKGAKQERAPRKPALVTLKKAPKEEQAPQAQLFLDALKKLGGKNVPTDKLCAAVEGKLKTKQPVAAVWNHYRRGYLESGVITVAAAE